MRFSFIIFPIFIAFHCIHGVVRLEEDTSLEQVQKSENANNIGDSETSSVKPLIAQRLVWGAILIIVTSALFSLVSYGALDLKALTDPDGGLKDKAIFFIVAVPSAFILWVLGFYFLGKLVQAIKDRSLGLLLLAVLGLLIFVFLSYVKYQRSQSQVSQSPEDGTISGFMKSDSSYMSWMWSKAKLPYIVLLDCLLSVIYWIIWLIFGLSCLKWMCARRSSIGYMVLTIALLYSYYYVSFYF